MSETVNQGNENNAANNNGDSKTFTQQELDAIVADRLKRERQKYEGFEDFKAKAQKYDELEEANKSELDKAHERVTTLETELNSLKKAEEIRLIREKVAKEMSIPASAVSLITGETEEACKEQAKAILGIAIPSSYPTIPDGGELQNVSKGTPKEAFKTYMSQVNF